MISPFLIFQYSSFSIAYGCQEWLWFFFIVRLSFDDGRENKKVIPISIFVSISLLLPISNG